MLASLQSRWIDLQEEPEQAAASPDTAPSDRRWRAGRRGDLFAFATVTLPLVGGILYLLLT